MEEIKFELSEEQNAELRRIVETAYESLRVLHDVFVEIAKVLIEKVRAIAEQLGRFFLKSQLLEWKIPHRIADFISEKIYWYWAVRLGFNWFYRKMTLLE